MWTFAWWWVLAALPLPWLMRRFASAEPIEMSPALKAPDGHALAALRAGTVVGPGALRWHVIALWAVWPNRNRTVIPGLTPNLTNAFSLGVMSWCLFSV